MKCKEIIGNRYGRLVVLEKMDKKTSNGCYIYKCKCDCGNTKEVSGTLLRSGNTKSCGCLAKEKASEHAKKICGKNAKNIQGKKFGKLTVIEPTNERQGSYVVWKCKCECGNEICVGYGNLVSGNTKSCGCNQKKDLSGKRFGMLTCIEPTQQRKNRSILWKCKCDCGNEILMQADYLKENRISSCGCNKTVDISGKKFGMLTAIKQTKKRSKHGSAIWECICQCGKTCYVSENSLANGQTKSCGCLAQKAWENARETFEKNELVENTALCNLTNKKRKDNTSGHKGVYWVQRVEMWRVLITCQGKTHNIGYFKDYDEAVIAREEAEKKYFEPILKKYGRNLETTSQ